MKLTNVFLLLVAGISLLGLAGCASYKSRPLKSLVIPASKPKEQSISFAHYIFTKSDCKRYLDRDVIAKGYQPVQFTLINNSKRHLSLSINSFSIPVVCPEEVAEKVHTSTIKRAASYGVGALFIPLLLIPAVIDGVGSSQANQQLDADFDQKSLRDQVISPYGTLNGLLFAPVEGFNPVFSFTIVDMETNQKFVLSTNNPQLKI